MKSQREATPETDLARYVDARHLFGRRGFTGLDWHCRCLLDGVDLAGGHAMEIGAGDGVISMWMLHAGAASVTSLEPEADGSTHGITELVQAHRQALGLDPARWTFLHQTFQDYVPDRRFRLILLQNSINHLDEDACVHLLEDPAARQRYRDLFAKMAGMLEPGGQVVLADCARTNHWSWLGRRSPWSYMIEWHKHQEPETWAAVLAEAGLVPEAQTWWHPFYRVRALQPLIGNRTAARWLSSYFVVRARNPG
jgi:2-polyprenyl-3-methyl-5-hydroxy-6-metoxy-1,4-benzoquinol methylase